MVPLGSVLLVDGGSRSAEAMAMRLRQDGYECDTAVDVEHAIALLPAGAYDLVMVDVPADGSRMLQFIQQVEEIAPGLPAIVVTETPSLETAVQSLELPVVAYLSANVPFEEIRGKVQAVMVKTEWFRGLRRIRDRLRQCADDLDDLLKTRVGATRQNGQKSARISLGTLQGIAGCLNELVSMISRRRRERQVGELCGLLQCPVWKTQQNVIYKAVLMLNETKRRFKSKELAQVRTMLERLLETLG